MSVTTKAPYEVGDKVKALSYEPGVGTCLLVGAPIVAVTHAPSLPAFPWLIEYTERPGATRKVRVNASGTDV